MAKPDDSGRGGVPKVFVGSKGADQLIKFPALARSYGPFGHRLTLRFVVDVRSAKEEQKRATAQRQRETFAGRRLC